MYYYFFLLNYLHKVILVAKLNRFAPILGVTFPAGVDVPAASVAEPGNDDHCLFTTPNPAWYYLEIAEPEY